MENEERDYACELFYYFSFASSCKREIHFIQVNYEQDAVIKNTIEAYLAGESVLLRANKSHTIQLFHRLKIQCCTI